MPVGIEVRQPCRDFAKVEFRHKHLLALARLRDHAGIGRGDQRTAFVEHFAGDRFYERLRLGVASHALQPFEQVVSALHQPRRQHKTAPFHRVVP